MTDAERDRRSGLQWLRSILSYLEFSSGQAWRRLSDPEQRWHPERLWYLDGIRAVQTLLASPTPTQTFEKKTDDVRIGRLVAMGRGWLATELWRANPSLTDLRILLRLRPAKLARILIEARDRQAAALRPTA
jgi:hypothetical protein